MLLLTATAALLACNSEEPDATNATGTASTTAPLVRRQALAAVQPNLARWSAVKTLPLVPVSAANLPDGRLLMWSAEEKFSFGGSGRTYSLTFDPRSEAVSERLVSETGHDMFCPGTTNLADGSGFLQVGISLSTFYDGKVISNIKRQQVPIRSAVLMVLAEQDPALLSTSQGKQRLQRQLTAAIHDVLRDKEGFGGVDNVYFTSLVIQ